MAAQILVGKGFDEVYNLSGGIKAWHHKAAFGKEDLGLDLFTGHETAEEYLVVAYGLEAGLREFYITAMAPIKDLKVAALFQNLSAIEVKHQDRIFQEYVNISRHPLTREQFEKNTIPKAIEGGLSTQEYMARFHPDFNSARDMIDLAMSIEAQALDLYLRASRKSVDTHCRKTLSQIADEEKAHLTQLGSLMDEIV